LLHNTHKRLVFACCGMELCWLCAWANFLAVSTTQIVFPLIRFCAAFFVALFLSYSFRAKSYRMVWLVLGHILGLGLMISTALSAGFTWKFPGTFYQGYQMTLMAAIVCLFWYKGIKLSLRQMSYETTCNYFDLGISLLFLLLIVKMLIYIKAGVLISESFTLYIMGVYFFFGLAALFLSQNTTQKKRRYLKGFRMYGGLISAFVVLLVCGMGMVFVLLPYMTSFAESGYVVLKQATGSLSPYLIAILRFIFSPRNHPGRAQLSQQNQNMPDPDIPLAVGQPGWAEHLLLYSIFSIFFLILVVMIGYILYKLFKFLMSKQPSSTIGKEKNKLFSWLIGWLVFLLNYFKTALLALNEKIEDAQKGFIKLVSWGRKSGMPKLYNETPAEYAKRLEQNFVPLENEIRIIVQAFHLETYGEMRLDQTKIFQVVKALKTIHSPSFWLLRIKSFWKML
jgi:hypothetical protein